MSTSRRCAWLLAALLPSGACQPSPAGDVAGGVTPDPTADRAAVEAVVAAHWAAINAQDSATVEGHHAPELTLITTEIESRFDYRSPEAAPFLAIVIPSKASYRAEDIQVQLYGDVAVASYYLAGGVVRPDGTRDDRLRRVTEVWVRRPDGSWKEAHHHDSVFAPL